MNNENQPQQPPAQQPSAGGSSKTVWIIVVVVLALLIIGGLVFYVLSRPKSQTETTTPSQTTTQPTSPTSEGKALPSKDVTGADLEVAPRYPDSVRVKYSKDPDGSFTKVTYQTKDSVDKVKEYYLDKMIPLGWQMTSSEEEQMEFEKEPAGLAIWFYYSKTNQITEYELRYSPE